MLTPKIFFSFCPKIMHLALLATLIINCSVKAEAQDEPPA
ncbi:MAG: hypothetical protein JWS10_238 [Cypionkella sp.]|nr:hypothetical protein [Cypionkella sp.]